MSGCCDRPARSTLCSPAHQIAITDAGHLSHIEQSGATLGAIGECVDTVVKPDKAT